jgi:hypothetical protein
VTDARRVKPGDRIETRLSRGRIVSQVEQALPEEPHGD